MQAQGNLNVSSCLKNNAPPVRAPRESVKIPGLDMVTYGERKYYVPGLAKPVCPQWEREYNDPRYYRSPPAHKMPSNKDQPCYVYNQRTNALEGNVS